VSPLPLVYSLARAAQSMLGDGVIGYFMPTFAILWFFQIPAAIGLWVSLKTRTDPLYLTLLCVGCGTILSAPFVIDGGYHGRILAATAPLTFILVGVGAAQTLN